MAGMSPDDYRRRAGGRFSAAAPSPRFPRFEAYQTHTMLNGDSDPVLNAFLRGGRESMTGVAVSDRMAMRNSVFYRGTSLIAGSMGMLPLSMHRKLPDGTTEKASDLALHQVLKFQPNHYQTPSEFKSFMQLAALFDGNAYARIVRLNGEIQALVPFERGTVKKEVSGSKFRFIHRPKSGRQETLGPDDVFHFRAPVSLDGVNGLGLLDIAADTIGLALTAEKAMSNLLRKGVMAGGAIQFPAGSELGDVAYERLKQSMAEQYSGAENAGDWMLLEDGGEAKPFSGTARDTQLVELRKFEAEHGARFTGVPRPLLMFDETAWGTGIEQLGLYMVVYCLLPWFVIWEEAIWRMLSRQQKQARDGTILYAKFNERALLRGSMKDQAEFLARALGSGGGKPWISQNEARDTQDMNPHDDGGALNAPTNDRPRPGTTAAAISEDDDDA